MSEDLKQYIRRESLIQQFEAEARELLAIARAAGDTLDKAVEWVIEDSRIKELYDKIDLLGGFPG